MEKIMFSHGGKFEFIDFQMSHYELLLRSYPYKERNYNIDILFKGVHSLNIITSFKGLIISAVPKSKGQTASVLNAENFIFKLTNSDGLECYIDAASFGVFKNTLEFGVSSLGNFMWSEANECIYWSHEDDEFKKIFELK